MMYGFGPGGFGFLGLILWVAVIADLILLGIWLLKKINKE